MHPPTSLSHAWETMADYYYQKCLHVRSSRIALRECSLSLGVFDHIKVLSLTLFSHALNCYKESYKQRMLGFLPLPLHYYIFQWTHMLYKIL